MHLRRFVLVRTVVPVLVSRRAAGLIFFVLFYGVWGDEDWLVFFVRVGHDDLLICYLLSVRATLGRLFGFFELVGVPSDVNFFWGISFRSS